MAEPRTREQRAAQEGFLWCRAHGAQVEWLDRELGACRISFVGWPNGRKITVIAPSFLDAYEELRCELDGRTRETAGRTDSEPLPDQEWSPEDARPAEDEPSDDPPRPRRRGGRGPRSKPGAR